MAAAPFHVRHIGYPCLNRTLPCRGNQGFRLKSWSGERFRAAAAGNLDCLERILRWNAAEGLLFFRLSSDLIPFASHPVNRLDWAEELRPRFETIGAVIRENGMRISMHPDPFTLLNSPDPAVSGRSAAELEYHARVLDLLGLDSTARVQIHVGGVYGDRPAARERFAERFAGLGEAVRRRLVIENDDRLWSAAECLALSGRLGVPVLLDTFHHALHPGGLGLREALELCARTWREADGPPMVDYSAQLPGERTGRHAESIDLAHFDRVLEEAGVEAGAGGAGGRGLDLMLEIKDKEASARRLRDHLAARRDSPLRGAPRLL